MWPSAAGLSVRRGGRDYVDKGRCLRLCLGLNAHWAHTHCSVPITHITYHCRTGHWLLGRGRSFLNRSLSRAQCTPACRQCAHCPRQAGGKPQQLEHAPTQQSRGHSQQAETAQQQIQSAQLLKTPNRQPRSTSGQSAACGTTQLRSSATTLLNRPPHTAHYPTRTLPLLTSHLRPSSLS